MTDEKKIFIAVLITSFMGPFMGSSINIAIPTMAAEFAVPAQELSWVVTAYLLGSVALLVPFGRLADIVGRRHLYAIGTIAVALMTFLAGLMQSVPSLVFFRLLQGLALATIFSTGMAMLVASHAPKERGRVIGYSAAATYIGLSLGPILGGLITQYLGWRLIFFLSAAANIVSALVALRVKGEWYGERNGGMDYLGCVLYSAASTMILYGLSAYASHPVMRYVFFGGLLLLAAFVYEQLRAKAPLIDISLFRSTIFAMSNLAALLNYSATFAISFLLSLYLQLIRGFDASTAGLFMLLQPMMMALLSPLAGTLSDKHEPRLVASAGMAITAIGIFGFSFLDTQMPMVLVGGIFLFIGTGFAFFSSPNSNAIMGAVSPRFYGVASSMLSLMCISGQAISMSVVTLLLAVYTASTVAASASPAYLSDLLQAIQLIFRILAVTCVFGVAASLARGNR